MLAFAEAVEIRMHLAASFTALVFPESPSQMFLSGYFKVLFSCKRQHFYNST